MTSIFSATVRGALHAMLVCAGIGAFVAGCAPMAGDPLSVDHVDVANPEDLALTGDGRWVIASSMADGSRPAGTLYGIDTHSGERVNLYPARYGDKPLFDQCGRMVPAEAFSPHGIAIQSIAPNQQTLFVVNHGRREAIDMFDIVAGESLSLVWRGCLPLPHGTIANAVAVTPDFRVYASVMQVPTEQTTKQDRWMGHIVVWEQSGGWRKLPDSDIYAPNGLLVSDDGNTVYINSWAAGEVIRLTTNGAVQRKALKLPFLPDNLRWGHKGSIIAAGLHAEVMDVVQCVMAPQTCGKAIPTGIAEIRTKTFSANCQRQIPMKMGTVALPVRSSLWVGAVRGDAVHILSDYQSHWDTCQH